MNNTSDAYNIPSSASFASDIEPANPPANRVSNSGEHEANNDDTGETQQQVRCSPVKLAGCLFCTMLTIGISAVIGVLLNKPVTDKPSHSPARSVTDKPSASLSRSGTLVPSLSPSNSNSDGSINLWNEQNKCMQSDPNTSLVAMKDCTLNEHSQFFEYDAVTRQIKHNELCLDNAMTDNVFTDECDGRKNQMWYHDTKTMELKTFNDNRCLNVGSEGNLHMKSCQGGDDQKFRIPIEWEPDIHLNAVHVMDDVSRCMDAHPSGSVYMEICHPNKTSQAFEYDGETRQIKRYGLCLDYGVPDGDPSAVYMAECDEGKAQKWYYDSNSMELKTLNNPFGCLYMASTDNGGLYMNDCEGGDIQKFLIPSSWEPEISTQPLDCDMPVADTTVLDLSANGFEPALEQWVLACFPPIDAFAYLKWNGLCISAQSGTELYSRGCRGGHGQRWKFESNGLLRLHLNQQCVGVSTGTGKLITQPCDNSNSQQKWGYDQDGGYLFQLKDRSKCATIVPSEKEHFEFSLIQLSDCSPGSGGSKPLCYDGIPLSSSKKNYCCRSTCLVDATGSPQCGGEGCDTLVGGINNCCSSRLGTKVCTDPGDTGCYTTEDVGFKSFKGAMLQQFVYKTILA